MVCKCTRIDQMIIIFTSCIIARKKTYRTSIIFISKNTIEHKIITISYAIFIFHIKYHKNIHIFFLSRKRGRPTTFRQPPKLSPKEILNGLVSAGDVPLKISFESGWLAPAEVVRLHVPILIARITQLTSGNLCETGLTRIAQLMPGNPCQQNVAHLCLVSKTSLVYETVPLIVYACP